MGKGEKSKRIRTSYEIVTTVGELRDGGAVDSSNVVENKRRRMNGKAVIYLQNYFDGIF